MYQEAEQLIADAVGDVIEHWGFRKALGRSGRCCIWRVSAVGIGADRATVDVFRRDEHDAQRLQEWAVVRRVGGVPVSVAGSSKQTDLWKMISVVAGA